MSFLKKNRILIFISVLLAIMPFFWMRPGEMDLGGDGGRLYFYDPVNFIKNVGSYYILPSGTGIADARFFYLPFVAILAGFKQVIHSSYVLISLHNAIKIVVGFLAVYAIVRELIGVSSKNNRIVGIASIVAGLFYLSTPAMIENYVRAIPTHNQVFLNPLMFYLLLRFFLTSNMRYVWVALVVSFVFANNFSYQGAPPFFAFYPLALFFIFLYTVFLRHVSIPWKKIFVGLSFFLGLHAFHLIPEILDIFNPGSNTNVRLSASNVSEQIEYFLGVLHIPKTNFYLFAYSLAKELAWFSVVIPFLALFGLFLNKRREKTILLASIFFLLTFFFVTGKVTNIGIEFYKLLFYIPGFTMFRNFYGQWQFAFYFFYALFFGLALFSILNRIKLKILPPFIAFILITYFALSSRYFINGNLVNQVQNETKNVKMAMVMDPKYEEAMDFIRSLPDDGKVLILPFTDSYDQVIHGLNDGAYVGSSTIGQLTGKKDFAGYVDIAPYSDIFWQLTKERDYESIKRLLGLLNIHYIFYNSDTRIYDTTFPGFPYSPDYVRKYMPPNQEGYKEFIKNLSNDKIFERSFYSVYKIEEKSFLPHFYQAQEIFFYEDDPKLSVYGKASAFFKGNIAQKPVYMENKTCRAFFPEKVCAEKIIPMGDNPPRIQFGKINPTKYKIKVFGAKEPYILVFSEAFHRNWKVFTTSTEPLEGNGEQTYFGGEIKEGTHKNVFFDNNTFETLTRKSLPENIHFVGNGYANAWLVSPRDMEGRSDYELIIEMTGQRVFYISATVSLLTFLGFLLWGVRLFFFSSKSKS